MKVKKNILALISASAIVLTSSNMNLTFADSKGVESASVGLDDSEDFDDSIEDTYELSENYQVEDFSSNTDNVMARTVVTIDAKKYGGLKGDGSNEAAKLQALFDKVKKNYPNQKVIIKFPEGKYHTNKKITVYSNMTIQGVKGKTYMKNTNRQPVFINGKEKSTSYKANAGSNIVLKGITFKNSRVMSIGHGKNITIDNVHVIDGPDTHAIEIAGSQNVVIKNSTFEGMNKKDTTEFMEGRDFNEFIQLDKMTQGAFPHFGKYNDKNYQTANKNVTIEKCTFKASKSNKYDVAIGTHGAFKNDVAVTSGLVIKGCTFENATNAAIAFPGISSMTIENNTFKNMGKAITYKSQMTKHGASSIKINNNKFNNVNNGVIVEQYREAKALKNLNITNNTFTHSKSGSTAINITGSERIKTITTTGNKISNYKKTTVKTKSANKAPVPKSTVVTVVNNNAAVRVSTQKSANVITTLKKGSKITVTDLTTGMWKSVKVNGKTGYILTKDTSYKSVTSSTTSNSSNASNNKPANNSSNSNTTSNSNKKLTGVITGDALRVRQTASTNGKILTKLYKGNKVTVLDTSNKSWIKIQTGKHTGYVSSSYIKIQ